jgi:hypothetical protein
MVSNNTNHFMEMQATAGSQTKEMYVKLCFTNLLRTVGQSPDDTVYLTRGGRTRCM